MLQFVSSILSIGMTVRIHGDGSGCQNGVILESLQLLAHALKDVTSIQDAPQAGPRLTWLENSSLSSFDGEWDRKIITSTQVGF
jgi:hypothetical protein